MWMNSGEGEGMKIMHYSQIAYILEFRPYKKRNKLNRVKKDLCFYKNVSASKRTCFKENVSFSSFVQISMIGLILIHHKKWRDKNRQFVWELNSKSKFTTLILKSEKNIQWNRLKTCVENHFISSLIS